MRSVRQVIGVGVVAVSAVAASHRFTTVPTSTAVARMVRPTLRPISTTGK